MCDSCFSPNTTCDLNSTRVKGGIWYCQRQCNSCNHFSSYITTPICLTTPIGSSDHILKVPSNKEYAELKNYSK